ncbi:hypothetical protein [Micromonospora sp. NBRC 107095]|uniref:hypothetical protein n=1 Tax=Micromonospora sp. NBRC 107095 TaxID=3032209 RepID=UPI0024A1327F|nr:hypothetical protein [Micromonospora sp. NBRC 107095]GLZ62880.1 hypothetical protein Misp05_64560 [Micromonospora sp. NBRC 107095]
MDVKQLIKGARLPEDTVSLCLRADLVAEYERVQAEHAKALEAAGDSLAGSGGAVQALDEQLTELRQEMTGSTLTLTLRALPSHHYQALMDEHPPRVTDEGVNPRDRLGFNSSTFFQALARTCLISPDLDDEDWEGLFGEDGALTDAQVSRVCNTAYALNRKDIDLPF